MVGGYRLGAALPKLGLSYTEAEVDLVFGILDTSGDGFIDYTELNAKLRPRTCRTQTHKLRTSLQLRRTPMLTLLGPIKKLSPCAEGSGGSVMQQLQAIVKDNMLKLQTIFAAWDVDGNGTIERHEFEQALASLGYDAPREDVDALFDEFDEDQSGELDYKELHRQLRQGGAHHHRSGSTTTTAADAILAMMTPAPSRTAGDAVDVSDRRSADGHAPSSAAVFESAPSSAPLAPAPAPAVTELRPTAPEATYLQVPAPAAVESAPHADLDEASVAHLEAPGG